MHGLLLYLYLLIINVNTGTRELAEYYLSVLPPNPSLPCVLQPKDFIITPLLLLLLNIVLSYMYSQDK